jgi:hypothetical protein
MGQVANKGDSKETEDFMKQYNFIKTEMDDRLGEFNLYEDKYNEYADYVLVKELKCDSKIEYDALKQKVERRKMLKNDFLVNLVASYSTVETEWCSKYYRHFLVYDHSSLTFEKELHDRYKMAKTGREPKVILL